MDWFGQAWRAKASVLGFRFAQDVPSFFWISAGAKYLARWGEIGWLLSIQNQM